MDRLSFCYQFADGIVHGRKFFFVFGHNISFIHGCVIVKVISAGGHAPGIGALNLVHGKIKQRPVVCLKFYLAVLRQNPAVPVEIFSGGKPPSCMLCLWPGVRKIKIDPCDFLRGEDVRELCHIHTDKPEVMRKGIPVGGGLILFCFFNGAQEDAGITFYADIIDLGMTLRECKDKLSFPHTYFYMDGMMISEYAILPSSFVRSLFFYAKGRLCKDAFGAWDIS